MLLVSSSASLWRFIAGNCIHFFIHFSYIISIFGIKRCRLLYFMKNFSRSLELSLDLALGTRVARDITMPRTFRMIHLRLDVLFTIVYRSACFL